MGKKQKFIYWFIGLGCGIMLSGLVMTFVGLNIKPSLEETPVLNNTQLAPVFETQGKNNSSSSNVESSEKLNILDDTHDETTNKSHDVSINEEEIIVKENYKWVEIPKAYNANQISILLEKEGIVENAVDFSNYIKEQKMTRKLMSGKQYLPVKGEYELVLNLLKADYKN